MAIDLDQRPSSDVVLAALRDLADDVNLDADAEALRIRSGALFARLKALNRAANAATRAHKQATTDARQEMDQTHLGLQNLLYEKRHLEREIDKCQKFAWVASRD
jgi:THO complex subunit 5